METIARASRELTEKIIACAMAVHAQLGPGFLEAVYQQCFAIELRANGLEFHRHRTIPLVYRGSKIQASYCFDFVVENAVLVEVKSVQTLAAVHRAQVVNYLKLTGIEVGLLINFNVPVLKEGVRRLEHPDHYRRRRDKQR